MNRCRLLQALKISWTAVCGMCCVLLLVLWIRSCWRSDEVTRVSSKRIVRVISSDGQLYASYDGNLKGAIPASRGTTWHYLEGRPFELRREWFAADGRARFCFPLGPPTIAFALVGVIPWVRLSTRFTVRTLLLVTTVAAVVLGLIVWVVRG